MHKLDGKRRGMWQRSGDDDELAELEQRLNSADFPEHALKVAQKELVVSPHYIGRHVFTPIMVVMVTASSWVTRPVS